MSLVFAGVSSHAPGITGRAGMADPGLREAFYANYRRMGEAIAAAKVDALIVVAAEHFANFFMNNMPAYAIGMADHYEGPIEDPDWLAIPKTRVPGNADLSQRLIQQVMAEVDVAFCEEWKFDHGIMVPLHFLTPKFDLPVIPVNINCQGPPLTPLKTGPGLRRGPAPRLRRHARADRPRRHRRHLALAGDARLRQDQRALGPRLPGQMVPQR